MFSLFLFAQGELPGWVPPVAFVSVASFVILFLVSLFAKQYKRCPSNRVLVIYGKAGRGEAAACVHGGARFVVPLIQDYGYLSLEPMQIEVALREVPSKDNVRVTLPSVFTVAIGTTPELMQNAAIRLLGLAAHEIRKQAEEIIVGQLRHVIASMGIEDINRDRDKFLKSIQVSLEPKLEEIGLVLINVNIADESGYIEAMCEKGVTAAVERVVTGALLRKLLAAFDVSPRQLVAHLLEEGELSEEDREAIRRLLDDFSSSS